MITGNGHIHGYLPDNYHVAKKRLVSLENRLLKNSKDAKLYSEQMQDMVDREVAREITQVKKNEYKGPVHYISHHEVLKPESTTPCRIVFDSSASYKGHSLNDYWAKGPTLINSLFGVLLRFRERRFALTGDMR